MSVIIGIDLGTTNSLVSYWNGSEAEIIPNALGENMTPSVVGVDDNGEVLVGKSAKERLITHPELTAALFKRYMGSEKRYSMADHEFSPEDLSSFVLRALKQDAEAFLNTTVEEAVVSVPAYFSDKQRKATQAAGQLAGLKVERLINEPTAAAISYGLHKQDESSFLVFDLGGGTFDVSVLSLFSGIMEVNATAGNYALGGEDFVDLLMKTFCEKNNLNRSELDVHSLSRLRWKIERLKHDLTSSQSSNLSITLNEQNYIWAVTREEFEGMSEMLITKMREPIERALNDASIMPSQLDNVLLVGGATRMPLVRSLAAKMFGKFPANHHNPDEVVAQGAAIQAGLKARDAALAEVILTDVSPHSLGTNVVKHFKATREAGFFHPIIERNTVVPVSREDRFGTLYDDQDNILIEIYQGESRQVKNNIKLGELVIDVPKAPAGEEGVIVRFTYDINGLLEVIVKAVSTSETKSIVIEENPGYLTREEIAKRLQELESIKIHPRETLENRTIIARAERLFEQTLSETREAIGDEIAAFEAVINTQNPNEIKKAYQHLNEFLNSTEYHRI